MNKKLFGALVATSMIGLVASANAAEGKAKKADKAAKPAAKANCEMPNSCKGKGACKTANNECKGKNACKGQGVGKQMTVKDQAACEKKHGKWLVEAPAATETPAATPTTTK